MFTLVRVKLHATIIARINASQIWCGMSGNLNRLQFIYKTFLKPRTPKYFRFISARSTYASVFSS